MPAPHFPTVKKKARTRPLVRKPRQQRSAPIEARRRREGAAPVLGRINADAALHAGLGWARKPKPGLILRTDSQGIVRVGRYGSGARGESRLAERLFEI